MADNKYAPVSGDTKAHHHHHSTDACACDWGPGDGGACWEICNCSCCSCWCCLCWYCCGLCTMSKFYAYSLKQRCAIVNHCLPVCLFPFCFAVITRHNLRKQRGIGDTEGCGGWCGDCCLKYWCGMCVPDQHHDFFEFLVELFAVGLDLSVVVFIACTLGQELRASHQDAWDWVNELNTHGLSVIEEPCMIAL